MDSQPSRPGGRILCVDDDRMVREVLTQMLERLGLQVDAVKDGQECLRQFTASTATPESYDLVVVNYDMPGMHGSEVVERLLDSTTPEHIVLTSAFPEGSVFERVSRADVAGFLRKPYTLSTLRGFLLGHLSLTRQEVLLASPDASNRDLYSTMIQEMDCRPSLNVQTSESPRDALDVASRSFVSLVVLDLPGGNVPPEAELFHRESIPLIFLCRDEAPRSELERYGTVIEYPVRQEDLADGILRVCGAKHVTRFEHDL